MGTPAFAVPSLRALCNRGHDVAAVFTQPDRPAGRGQAETASAIKRFALERGLRVEQPQKLRDPAVLATLRTLSPQVIAVAAYGKILPKAMLELPPLGAINVHGSLLPRHRGAAPIQRAILVGDATTGITIMQMNEGMDTGDMLLHEATEIRADDTAATLGERLAEIGARLLVEALDGVERGTIVARPQNDAEATLAPLVKKEDGEIDWRRSAAEIERAVRAFTPWPSAYTKLGGKLLKLHRAVVVDTAAPANPGTVVDAGGDDLDIATGAGTLRILELQLEGKRRLRTREFLAGQPLHAGDKLG